MEGEAQKTGLDVVIHHQFLIECEDAYSNQAIEEDLLAFVIVLLAYNTSQSAKMFFRLEPWLIPFPLVGQPAFKPPVQQYIEQDHGYLHHNHHDYRKHKGKMESERQSKGRRTKRKGQGLGTAKLRLRIGPPVQQRLESVNRTRQCRTTT